MQQKYAAIADVYRTWPQVEYRYWARFYDEIRSVGSYVIYLRHNKKHRVDGPAIESANGDKEWYVNDKCHRTDGPAIVRANGSKVWRIDGKRHRTDGPAIQGYNGDKMWYVDDQLHRTDGPAVEYANGICDWYMNGKIQFQVADDVFLQQAAIGT